ncbi:MAG TPA: acetate/propionate family kinase, partial [Sorangium sp.]|nr:acetate/propionate family kinase [Sorangium sp.]
MLILVINCGSSSIKAAVVHHDSGKVVARMRASRIGSEQPLVAFNDAEATAAEGHSHQQLLASGLPKLLASLPVATSISGVGHRVVHGGARFRAPTRIDDDVVGAIEQLIALAPLHNPANLAGIVAARALLPQLPHVAVFDTAFHATLPRRARAYAIDAALAKKHGLRRYGFHGTSHAYVAERAAALLKTPLRDLRLISCHIGNGASVCAIEYGRSVETSMGMTPLEGLVMGTRSGDIDAGILLHLMRQEGLDADGLDSLLNRHSGLTGLSGVGNDMRDIEERAGAGDASCQLAIHVAAHRLRKYIGAYAAVLGGVDAVVFTGGIGENSATFRHRVCQRLEVFGACLDEQENRQATLSAQVPAVVISTRTSRTHLLVVATDEQHAIAKSTAALVAQRDRIKRARPIAVAISARHIHLTEATIAALFGAGHQLTPRNPLSQPGQFACEETLEVVGPKRSLKNVRILGPARSRNQIEVSRTDEFYLGIDAPVRDSGDTVGSAGVTLVGPAGKVVLEEGVICARRHIHMTPDDAAHYGVEDRDVVEVAINSAGRDLVFGDVLIRVSPKYALEMHIDTDEANAAELSRGAEGMLMPTQGSATLRKRKPRP